MNLTICAITYNESEHLQKWYELHKELADEIFIVDTGSYDNTIEVAKELGIKVYTTKWRHDFAEAKNKALRIATGDWVLFQNPDLWTHPDNFPVIRKAMENENIKGYALPCTGSLDIQFCDIDNIEKTREVNPKKIWSETHLCLFRNDPNIEYRHRVHENVNESIIEYYGREAIDILPVLRYHDSPKKVYYNKKKTRYYWCLEDMGAMERKFWEHAEFLRKEAYDAEL